MYDVNCSGIARVSGFCHLEQILISLNRKQSGKKFQKIVKFYIEILNS